MRKTLEERFLEKINKDGPLCENLGSKCWDWTACKCENGYGRIGIGNFPKLAHRISYELYKGKIPDTLEIDHKCRNRSCCNPDHLEPVTHKVNVDRGDNNGKKTHCPKGHIYSINKIVYKNKRQCKICRQEYRDSHRPSREQMDKYNKNRREKNKHK